MNFSKETLSGRARPEPIMQTSLKGIASKAKRDKQYRFRDLYRFLNYNGLRECWNDINIDAAAGVDQITTKEFAENLDENIREIVDELKEKRYRAKLVRRVYIDKGNGKKRPLGIPTIKDKLVQTAVAKILSAIYEEDFIESSYGYRPKRSVHTALEAMCAQLQHNKYSYIVEADIRGYFDNIDHNWLIKMLEQRINDKKLIQLINKWLKAGILDTDKQVILPEKGSPQGGTISPILANIYLHYVLDIWFEKKFKGTCEGEAYLCRYADDFLCAFRYKKDAERFYKTMKDRFTKFGLSLAEEKTNLISFSRFRKYENTCVDFLGFEIRWGTDRKGKDSIRRRTSRNKLRKSIAAFKEWCKENRNLRIRKLFDVLNLKLAGYYNHYGIIGNYDSLNQFYQAARRILFKWLNRRSQRRSFNWKQYDNILKIYSMLKPRITEKRVDQLQLDFSFV